MHERVGTTKTQWQTDTTLTEYNDKSTYRHNGGRLFILKSILPKHHAFF